MGFPSVSMKMPCLGFKFLVTLLACLKIVFSVVFSRLRRQTPAPARQETETPNYVLLINRLCPTPVPVPVEVLTSLIKKRLLVVEFKAQEEDKAYTCPVCLDVVNNSNEIRDLCNCSHVFHRECLDHWVDEGQVTCPLCRSMLFPDNVLTCTSQDPWISQRNISGGDAT